MNPAAAAGSVVADTLAAYETLQDRPPGSLLFREGDNPDGVYFIHTGNVDLCFASPRGESKALLVAGPGELIGLTCVVSGRTHDCSATARTPSTVGYIPKETFLRLLDEKPALWLSVLQMISSNINACWDCMRSISAGRSH